MQPSLVGDARAGYQELCFGERAAALCSYNS
jgi:hypothetical protein